VLILVGVALAVVLGLLWKRSHDRWVAETALARHVADSLQAAFTKDRAERQAEHVADSLRTAARIRAADQAYLGAQASARAANQAFQDLLDSLATDTTRDNISLVISRLQAGWAEVVRRHDSTVAAAEERVHERDLKIEGLEAEIARTVAACDSAMAEAMKQLEAALQRTSPSFYTRVVRAVPVVLGAIGGWELAKVLTRQ
jgi:hypothetical protein